MARRRTLHPDFFTDPKILELKPLQRLFFEGLWCYADKHGVLVDDPQGLAIKILPRESSFDAGAAMARMATLELIKRYHVSDDPRSFAWIIHFDRYQRPHPNEASTGFLLPPNNVPESQPGLPMVDQGDPKVNQGAPKVENGKNVRQISGSSDLRPSDVETKEACAAQSATPPPKAGPASSEPARPKRKKREGGELATSPPRVRALLQGLMDAHKDVLGAEYVPKGRDFGALKELAEGKESDGELIRRWRIALRCRGFDRPTDIFDFNAKVNRYATDPNAPAAKDITKGYAPAKAEWTPEEIEAFNATGVGRG